MFSHEACIHEPQRSHCTALLSAPKSSSHFYNVSAVNVLSGTSGETLRGRFMLLAFFSRGVTVFEALAVAPSTVDIVQPFQKGWNAQRQYFNTQNSRLWALKVPFVLSTRYHRFSGSPQVSLLRRRPEYAATVWFPCTPAAISEVPD